MRTRKRGAAAEDERERRGVDRRQCRYRTDDVQILFDQTDARQPEISLDLPELALCVIAQAATPYPDNSGGARNGPSRARPD